MVEENMTIVMQGDSVTDASRRFEPEGLGEGYAAMTIKTLRALYPDYHLACYNRGIGGNRSEHLVARWKEDCLDLHPDIVTLLIGANDCWHGFDDPSAFVTTEQYAKNCEYLMKSVKESGAKLIVIEPFYTNTGNPTAEWERILNPMIYQLRILAAEYADRYIPMHAIFAALSLQYKPEQLCEDGVHPTKFGHRILAKEVLKAMDVL